MTTAGVVGVPVSIRLHDDVRGQLEDAAGRLGIGLGVFPRDLAMEAARDAKRARPSPGMSPVPTRRAPTVDAG